MFTDALLDKAVTQGIISREQVEALVKLSQARSEGELDFSVSARDEPFRLLKGFRDFFIAIGISVLAVGLSMLAYESFESVFDGKVLYSLSFGFVSVLIMAALVFVALVISEWVTKSQRLPLSSLILTLVFALWTGLLCGTIVQVIAMMIGVEDTNKGATEVVTTYAGLIGAIGALLLYYQRYKLPFVLLPLAGVAVTVVILLVKSLFDLDATSAASRIASGLCGVGVFIAAMKFDFKDRFRTTRLSECAFWLHLLAAPLIVHSVLLGLDKGILSAITVLLIVALLAIFALLIDRRAVLVSALIYMGYSLYSIIDDFKIFGGSSSIAVLIILGVFILGLGLGWTSIRRFLVNNLLSPAWRDKLPPVIS